MKKTSFLSMLALTLLIAVGVTSCKPKDADILKAVQTAIATSPDAAGVTAAVDKGVVTDGRSKRRSHKHCIKRTCCGSKKREICC